MPTRGRVSSARSSRHAEPGGRGPVGDGRASGWWPGVGVCPVAGAGWSGVVTGGWWACPGAGARAVTGGWPGGGGNELAMTALGTRQRISQPLPTCRLLPRVLTRRKSYDVSTPWPTARRPPGQCGAGSRVGCDLDSGLPVPELWCAISADAGEVARLAGVSTEYDARLEQGRAGSPSPWKSSSPWPATSNSTPRSASTLPTSSRAPPRLTVPPRGPSESAPTCTSCSAPWTTSRLHPWSVHRCAGRSPAGTRRADRLRHPRRPSTQPCSLLPARPVSPVPCGGLGAGRC